MAKTTFSAYVGGDAVQQNVIIANQNSEQAITVSNIAVTGNGFSLTNSEVTTLEIAAGQDGTISITFTPGELQANTYTGTLTYNIGTDEFTEDLEAVLSVEENNGGNTPVNPDPDPATGDDEEETEEEEVNDFFSRKDVTGEVIRVFEEDYWPVDFVNVEPDKFAIMPGEGVELDCMFGDSSIPAAETTTEPEGTGN
jgi:hypothetical protein